VKFLVTKY